VRQAIAVATEEAVEPDSPSVKRRRRRTAAPPDEPVNEPLAFIQFVAEHPLGSEVEGEVDTFSSHGTFVNAGGARCYVPLSGLGDPPPRAAREVVKRGEQRAFVVQALDPARRGIELALPGLARVSGTPTPETVEEEIRASAPADETPAEDEVVEPDVVADQPPRRPRARRNPARETVEEEPPKRATPRKTPAKKAVIAKAVIAKAVAKKAPVKNAVAKKAPVKKSVAKKAAAKKAPAKKSVAKKATARKSVVKRAVAAEPVTDA
jgi:hypothetical protein